ncbi:hypothetical protein MHYP_G00350890 [Metynnis hypsauchen]
MAAMLDRRNIGKWVRYEDDFSSEASFFPQMALKIKQQALLAAISEKDANIALLELSASKKKTSQEEVMALKREKDRLMYQLKQQTQSRMKLIAENYEDGHVHPHHSHHTHPGHPGYTHHRGPPRGPASHANHRAQIEQDDEEGIWA